MATDLIIMPSIYDQRSTESPLMIDFLDDTSPPQEQQQQHDHEGHLTMTTTNEWACPKCTLLNPQIAPICSLCREINPSVVQEANEITAELVTVPTRIGQEASTSSPSYSNYNLQDDAINTRQLVTGEVGQQVAPSFSSYGNYQLDEDAALARQLAAQDASQAGAAAYSNYVIDDAAIARQLAASESTGFAVITSSPTPPPNNGTISTAIVPATHYVTDANAVVDLATKKRRRSRRRARMVLAGSTGLVVGAVTLGPIGAIAGTAIGATAARMASKNAERRKDARVNRERRAMEESFLPNNNNDYSNYSNNDNYNYNRNVEEDSIRQID